MEKSIKMRELDTDPQHWTTGGIRAEWVWSSGRSGCLEKTGGARSLGGGGECKGRTKLGQWNYEGGNDKIGMEQGRSEISEKGQRGRLE